ncbi:MAG: DUF6531 domain-containing protein, partial [Candidatus Thiodiazotropha sp.]
MDFCYFQHSLANPGADRCVRVVKMQVLGMLLVLLLFCTETFADMPPMRTDWFYVDAYGHYGQCFSSEAAMRSAHVARNNSYGSMCDYKFHSTITDWPNGDEPSNAYQYCVPERVTESYVFQGFAHMELKINEYIYTQAANDCDPPTKTETYNYNRVFYFYCPKDSSIGYEDSGELVCKSKYYVTFDPNNSCPEEGNPCSPATGRKIQTETDFSSGNNTIAVKRYYSSQGSNSSFNALGGYWQHNYTAHLDSYSVPIYDQIRLLKSSLFGTPERACLAGWGQLKLHAPLSIISDGTAVYDGDLCKIQKNGVTVLVLPIHDTIFRIPSFESIHVV